MQMTWLDIHSTVKEVMSDGNVGHDLRQLSIQLE